MHQSPFPPPSSSSVADPNVLPPGAIMVPNSSSRSRADRDRDRDRERGQYRQQPQHQDMPMAMEYQQQQQQRRILPNDPPPPVVPSSYDAQAASFHAQQQAQAQAQAQRIQREQAQRIQQQQQAQQIQFQQQQQMQHAHQQAQLQQQQQQQAQAPPPRARERDAEREREREREREHLHALTSQHPGTATSARYEGMGILLPRAMSPLPAGIPVVFESPAEVPEEEGSRRCFDLGTFVHPNTPLPLPVMSVMPSWVTPPPPIPIPAADGGLPADDPLPAPIALHAPLPLTKSEKDRLRRERSAASHHSGSPFMHSPAHAETMALLVPAPSYAFTVLIPAANLLERIPEDGACEVWGTQGNAPAFSSASSSPSSSVPLAKASSSSTSASARLRAMKEERDRAAASPQQQQQPQQRLPGDMWEGTLGYTDDSDVRLIVLHAGFVTLADMRAARHGIPSAAPLPSADPSSSQKKKKAAAVEVPEDPRVARLVSMGGTRDLAVRFLWRGVKSRFKGSLGPKEGGSVQSAAWGTSHDGGVLEVERVEWVGVRSLAVVSFSHELKADRSISPDTRIRDIGRIGKRAWHSTPRSVHDCTSLRSCHRLILHLLHHHPRALLLSACFHARPRRVPAVVDHYRRTPPPLNWISRRVKWKVAA